MQNHIILVSDDSDFFEYISPKLKMRKNDELYHFGFGEILEYSDIITDSLLIINSEKNEQKTLDLLNIAKGAISVVFNYNDNEDFRAECYKNGMIGYITPMVSDKETEAIILSAMNSLGIKKKSNAYREILVSKNLIHPNNEVFIDYNNVIEKELKTVKQTASNSVLTAISPNEKTKFLIKPNQIETLILNHIRKNDLLMSYATNKYFIIFNDTDTESAKKIWENIQKLIPEKMYAGFADSRNINTRGQWVNEALNKLHESINRDYILPNSASDYLGGIKRGKRSEIDNFKIFREEFNKKFEQIVTPVFYHVEQKYGGKFFEISLSHIIENGYGEINTKSRYLEGSFKITSPGFSKINVDISYKPVESSLKLIPETKRITLEPDELESDLLEDLTEQFILEFKREADNEYTK